MKQEFENPKAQLLYDKGVEIVEVVEKLCELMPDNGEMLAEVKSWIRSDASQLVIKVAGAEGGGLYDLKMESATIIRKSARDLMIQKHNLSMHGFDEVSYFQIVRNLIEEYRLLFIDWVAAFDQWDYVIDRWGLFNPLGIGPFDKDPDEDIPSDPSDFLE